MSSPSPVKSATSAAAPPKPRSGFHVPGFHVPGLDGVRAVAVGVVILFHLTPGFALGGYLGVDIFFVVSGYLITTLLLREKADSGRIALGAFWTRRARRLLPALALLLLVCCSAALWMGGDVLVGLGLQVLGAATFSSNWLFLAAGSSYFAEAVPELFRNLWSLAVEEQFYLVWPLLLVLVLLRMPRWARVACIAALAVVSAVAMAMLWDPVDSTRVYYGTDTHSFGLAIGALLAVIARPWPSGALAWPRAARTVLGIAGPVALAGLLVLAAVMPGDGPLVFRGGLVVVALLTAIVIAALLVPGGPLARVLDLAPLRWIGARSYGLYLWHWPVFVLVVSALPAWQEGALPWALGGIALGITVIAAALSYRFVEQPIRRTGFRATARAVLARVRVSPLRAVSVGVATLLVVAGGTATGLAIASDPGSGETQVQVQAGEQAIQDAAGTPDGAPASLNASAPAPQPAHPVGGEQISAIGDSVMLAAAPTLQAQFPGIAIDAAVSRQMNSAPGIVQGLIDAGALRPVLVVELGTNGPIDPATLEQLRTLIGSDHELVVVSAQAPRGWIPGVNQELTAFAQHYRNVELSNWHDAVQPYLGELNRDQIHFGPTGARIFTDALRDALQRLAELPPLRDESADESLPKPV